MASPPRRGTTRRSTRPVSRMRSSPIRSPTDRLTGRPRLLRRRDTRRATPRRTAVRPGPRRRVSRPPATRRRAPTTQPRSTSVRSPHRATDVHACGPAREQTSGRGRSRVAGTVAVITLSSQAVTRRVYEARENDRANLVIDAHLLHDADHREPGVAAAPAAAIPSCATGCVGRVGTRTRAGGLRGPRDRAGGAGHRGPDRPADGGQFDDRARYRGRLLLARHSPGAGDAQRRDDRCAAAAAHPRGGGCHRTVVRAGRARASRAVGTGGGGAVGSGRALADHGDVVGRGDGRGHGAARPIAESAARLCLHARHSCGRRRRGDRLESPTRPGASSSAVRGRPSRCPMGAGCGTHAFRRRRGAGDGAAGDAPRHAGTAARDRQRLRRLPRADDALAAVSPQPDGRCGRGARRVRRPRRVGRLRSVRGPRWSAPAGTGAGRPARCAGGGKPGTARFRGPAGGRRSRRLAVP